MKVKQLIQILSSLTPEQQNLEIIVSDSGDETEPYNELDNISINKYAKELRLQLGGYTSYGEEEIYPEHKIHPEFVSKSNHDDNVISRFSKTIPTGIVQDVSTYAPEFETGSVKATK